MARPLPERDVHALFDVVVTFLGHLLGGGAPPGIVQHMVRRLAQDGFLRPGASAGELGALIGDLVQRLHFAMGAYETLPAPTPRETTHSVLAPDRAAALACRDELAGLGGTDVLVRNADADGWEVLATFPELAPDPAFEERADQLDVLARRHGCRYNGSQR